MESNDYAKRIRDIKNEILDEIRKLIPEDSAHSFEDTFYVHYVEGEVATTEICHAVEVWHGGMVVFIVSEPNLTENVVEGDKVYQYDSNSFLDILDHLKKDIREKKLQTLREIVKSNGGKISFDGSFGFLPVDGEILTVKCMIKGIELDSTYQNRIYIDTICCDEDCEEQEENIPFEELDNIISYVKQCTVKHFKIRAYETFSRIFEIEASTYEEAVDKVREELECLPFNEGDSDGLCFD